MKKHKATPFGWAKGKKSVHNGNGGYQPTETTPAAPPTHGSNIRKEDVKTGPIEGWKQPEQGPLVVGDIINPYGTDFVAKIIRIEGDVLTVQRFLPGSELLYYKQDQVRRLR